MAQDTPVTIDALRDELGREGFGQGQPDAHAAMPYSTDDFRKEIKRVKRNRVLIVVLSIVLVVVAVLAIVSVAVLKMPGSLYTVNSDNMAPVLTRGQVALTEDVGTPSAGDVIVFKDAQGTEQVKRVVAVGGDWVNVASDGSVAISATPLDANASGALADNATVIASRQVPNNSCFVLADTDANAVEALYQTANYVSYGKIRGRVYFRVWPITSIGGIS